MPLEKSKVLNEQVPLHWFADWYRLTGTYFTVRDGRIVDIGMEGE